MSRKDDLYASACSELIKLEAENAKLREAAKPLCDYLRFADDFEGAYYIEVSLSDLQALAALLEGKQDG